MKKIFFSLLTLIILAFIFYLSFHLTASQTSPSIENNSVVDSIATSTAATSTDPKISTSTVKTADFILPLDKPKERITKKPFGIYITPKTSPVQPEKFTGYHTGVDFEIFPNELNSTVSVQAICAGKLVMKKTASGYGGVAVQDCIINKAPVTVIYGHLKLASINKKVGDSVKAGEVLGVLGANKSVETYGERKHLHLGIHKGTAINIKGYVGAKSELSDWIDPCLYACKN